MDGTIEDDLVAFAGTVAVNGVVEGDLIAAGQLVTLNGRMTDDARIAGYSLVLESGADVGDDVISAGFSNVDVAGGAVELAGTIGGNVAVDVGGAEPGAPSPAQFMFFPNMPTVPKVPAGLTVREGARIAGDLQYTANERVEGIERFVGGETSFTQYIPEVEVEPEAVEEVSTGKLVLNWFVGHLRRLITLLLVGVLMMWLVPEGTRKVAGVVQAKPLPSLGWGVVAIAAFFFGLIVISLLLGQLIFRLFKSPAAEHRWWPVLLGALIFIIITAIPVLGWLAKLATLLLGLGALWITAWEWWRARRAAPVEVEVEAPEIPPLH